MAPLAMLLLPSCEPPRRSDDGEKMNPDQPEWSLEKMAPVKVNEELLAAQDSVGKEPGPRAQTGTVPDTCPVHREKMKIRQVPIVFEDSATEGTETANPDVMSAFPFAAEEFVSPGNALLPDESTTARVYQCSSCIAAKLAAKKMRGRSVELPAPK